MRSLGKWISAAATVILTGLLILPASVSSQSSVSEEGKRKVKTRVAAVYPELARRMNVTGKVKIEVVIAPDGHVKSTHVIGGHPLLVNPAVDAVKEWKFVAASEETTQIVEIEFKSNDN
ncbi:MAG TPA: energy transducer TonB [Candidatus Limnocylindria bacterium]|nr:energy transducer TonB [Candidatus Limnocylindria bacterium]